MNLNYQPVKPVCKKCEEEGEKYSVTQGASMTTLLASPSPYWNEAGEYIIPPDPNSTTTSYTCSNGHGWTEAV